MTSKERILNALHGRDVDYLPFSPNLAYVWEFFPKDIQKLGWGGFQKLIGCDPLWRGAPCVVRTIQPDKLRVVETKTDTHTFIEHHTPVGVTRQGWTRSVDGNTNLPHRASTQDRRRLQSPSLDGGKHPL